MPFEWYEVAVRNGLSTDNPNSWYRNLEQAFIDANWDNTTSLRTIQEQDIQINQFDYYESFTFTPVDVWLATVVGQTSTGSKTGRDFLKIIFQNIDHIKLEGRYYIIENEYYLSYFDNRVVDVDANLSVRRCNEWMKIIDPLSGALYQIPCVVDYDMSAPSNKITNSIITPNNHAVVKVQQNAMTDRLFKTNKRFILGNRPFKIAGMQNATNQFINNNVSSLMDIDLFLDEIWENDDLENGIADNGQYNYSISINNTGNTIDLLAGSSGQFIANVKLNNQDVDRIIEWTTSDENVINITPLGLYQVVGEIGDVATIRATLYNNSDVFDEITVQIVESSELELAVVLSPEMERIGEYQTITVNVMGLYNGTLITPDQVNVILPVNVNSYLTYQQENNNVIFTCLNRCSAPILVTYEIYVADLDKFATKEVLVTLTSLLG